VSLLYDEPRVLLVGSGHRLAGAESVTLEDIADEPLPRVLDPVWDAFWRIDPRPDGRPAPGGPVHTTIEDKFEFIASGQAVAIIASGGIGSLRPDLTTVPLEDVEPSHVALASRAGDHSRLVAAFRDCAETHLTGPGIAATPEDVSPDRPAAKLAHESGRSTTKGDSRKRPLSCPSGGGRRDVDR
jgi:DNA-binding transcriptional LysR family regulator